MTVAAVKIPLIKIDSLTELTYFREIKDSKQLTPAKRESLAKDIRKDFEYQVSHVSVGFIDKYNINTAIQYAIYRITQSFLQLTANHKNLLFLFIDGNYKFNFPHLRMVRTMPPIYTQIKGDASCLSIACASILAKVCRDQLLADADSRFPQYQLKKNKGYGTNDHLGAIRQWGISRLHRKSFLKRI